MKEPFVRLVLYAGIVALLITQQYTIRDHNLAIRNLTEIAVSQEAQIHAIEQRSNAPRGPRITPIPGFVTRPGSNHPDLRLQ